MAFKRQTKVLHETAMSSMTDLVFLLLIFFLITSTPVPFEEVEDELTGLLQTEEDPTFSIYADQSVPVKEVVAVMNIAKRNHYKVILATQPE